MPAAEKTIIYSFICSWRSAGFIIRSLLDASGSGSQQPEKYEGGFECPMRSNRSFVNMQQLNRIRYYHFVTGVLANQQHDPYCSICKAFTNSVREVRGGVDEFMHAQASELPGLLEEVSIMLADIKMMLADLHPVPDAVGQKKAGNCKLPQGVCFVKSSKALLEITSS
jgi:hypothetical protein